MVQATVVTEAEVAQASEVERAIRAMSLSNCKQIVQGLPSAQVLVHIACNDLPSLGETFTRILALDGITRATCVVLKR